jgi:hypothetical protein
MNTSGFSKPRPYWHVDAKWITGILLLFLLNGTFLLFILVQTTAPERGIDLLTVLIASSFSREGLDQEADLEIMHQKIAESPNGAWQPIPSLKIVVREEDIAGLTPREMRLWFFRQLAEPIYYDGQQGLAGLASDPEMAKNMEGGIGPFGFISAETHGKLQKIFFVFGFISLTLLGLLVFFSYRFGRLGSPGCVLFLAALPGLIVFSMLRGWLEGGAENLAQPTEITALTLYAQPIARLATEALPEIVQMGIQAYLILILLGLTLILLTLIGPLFLRKRKNKGLSEQLESIAPIEVSPASPTRQERSPSEETNEQNSEVV